MTFGLWDRIRDWVLLFCLLAVAVLFMLALNQPLLRGLRRVSIQSTAWLETRMAGFGGYFRALDENRQLREQNILLSSELARSREAVVENKKFRKIQ